MYLSVMDIDAICHRTRTGANFAHFLSRHPLKTQVLRDLMMWMCYNVGSRHISPLYKRHTDRVGEMADFEACKTPEHARSIAIDWILNCTDNSGQGCLDIVMAQTGTNYCARAIARLKSLGAIEMVAYDRSAPRRQVAQSPCSANQITGLTLNIWRHIRAFASHRSAHVISGTKRIGPACCPTSTI